MADAAPNAAPALDAPPAHTPSPPASSSPVAPRAPTRVGMVIELKRECLEAYKAAHAAGHAGVRDLLAKWHLRNFTIHVHDVHGRLLEFASYDYTGTDFARDMAGLAAEPRNAAWLAVCDPMQLPLPGGSGWSVMEEVYYNH